mmetsp:Transcript_3263/g.4191  ORF Transcript_3263/g.4191 Transcript_3263/m.4191 type:complete len:108 (-) Transcript_3263:159-482(-)
MSKRFESIFKKRGKRSAIINISSVIGIRTGPCLGTYAATKGFVNYFGLSQSRELKDTNIDYQVWSPSETRSNLISESAVKKDLHEKMINGALMTDAAVREALRGLSY